MRSTVILLTCDIDFGPQDTRIHVCYTAPARGRTIENIETNVQGCCTETNCLGSGSTLGRNDGIDAVTLELFLSYENGWPSRADEPLFDLCYIDITYRRRRKVDGLRNEQWYQVARSKDYLLACSRPSIPRRTSADMGSPKRLWDIRCPTNVGRGLRLRSSQLVPSVCSPRSWSVMIAGPQKTYVAFRISWCWPSNTFRFLVSQLAISVDVPPQVVQLELLTCEAKVWSDAYIPIDGA